MGWTGHPSTPRIPVQDGRENIHSPVMSTDQPSGLRRGWTTGTCATAAARAAYEGLVTGHFPDPVTVTLPNGAETAFALATTDRGRDHACAGVVKDAGDDPDVTHGAVILATARHASKGSGIGFLAGPGVGTVTRPGLALAPGEPAINPVPRAMIRATILQAATLIDGPHDVTIEIAVPGGEKLAERTLNGRLGIVGGLSILGTTGIVVPYSCAAWIDTIHRGIDVARALGLDHVAGATGATSETTIQAHHRLPEPALIDMGDFVGGMLKYLRRRPVTRVTVAGGVAKMSKLGQGLLDLHSKRGEVDRVWLAQQALAAGASQADATLIDDVNTIAQAFDELKDRGVRLADQVATAAWRTAAAALGAGFVLDVALVDRAGAILAVTEPRPT